MKAWTLLLALALACDSAYAFDPFHEARIERIANARVPLELSFRDETGTKTTIGAVAGGKPILLAPVLHECPNICGVTLGGLFAATRAQPYVAGKDFVIVAFGIDPKEGPREAHASLAALKESNPDFPAGGLRALTGSAENIAAVAGALGYRYAWDERIGQYAHAAAVAALTPDGHLARWLYGVAPEPKDVQLALTEAGEGRLGGWSDRLLLLCYHYDPHSGRYSPIIFWLLRGGATLTLALCAGFIGLALRREWRRAGA